MDAGYGLNLAVKDAHAVRENDMAIRVGNPAAYHETTTAAVLSLIAERRAAGQYADFETCGRDHFEPLNRSILARCFVPARLISDFDRPTFVTLVSSQ